MAMFRNKPREGEPEETPADPGKTPAPTPEPDPDETAALLDQISAELSDAVKSRDDAMEKWKRALADFQNYQRRALTNEQEAKRQGITAVLHTVLPVLDHFDIALSPEARSGSVDQIVQGVTAIRAELIKALEVHGIRVINPAPGADFDPNQHQAIVTQPAPPGVDPGRIVSTFQAGYALGDRILRPAKVAVAAAPAA